MFVPPSPYACADVVVFRKLYAVLPSCPYAGRMEQITVSSVYIVAFFIILYGGGQQCPTFINNVKVDGLVCRFMKKCCGRGFYGILFMQKMIKQIQISPIGFASYCIAPRRRIYLHLKRVMKMTKLIRNIILAPLFVMLAVPVALAQVTKVNIETRHSPRGCYVDVYEYDYVDVPPQFPGGDRAMVNFINKTRVYPYEAYKRHIAGRVVCSFIVDIDGSICNVSVVKGANALLDKEAVRVIKEMPDWKAGKLRGEPVPVRCFLPIPFRL